MRTRFWLLLCLLLPAAAEAWGDEGHEVIGLIAEHFLTPSVRLKVNALLATDTSHLTADTSLASETTWADRFRDSDRNSGGARYRATREWHYVDIKIRDGDLDAACFGSARLPRDRPASAAPAHRCIVDQIAAFSDELASPATPAGERLVALQFLLHFVGDLHQPLHASDDQDRGGNDKHVVAAGFAPGTLHQYWDSVFVSRLGESSAGVAQRLITEITPALRQAWSQGTAGDWARQSFALGRSIAYGELPRPDASGVYELPAGYVEAASDAVRVQMERAGVRLAAVLNAALGDSNLSNLFDRWGPQA
jgi:hypothetical protein